MRSPKRVLVERIRRACLGDSERFIDVACYVRAYRRGPDGGPVPFAILRGPDGSPTVFGGRYDRLARRYAGKADRANIRELKIHGGQVPMFEAIGTDQQHVLGLGAQGGGKTEGLMAIATAMTAMRCNGLGLIVAPTDGLTAEPWRKYLARVQSFGWVDDIRLGDGEIHLRNGTLVRFRGAAKQSEDRASPMAGLDAHWVAMDEESYFTNDAMREARARLRISKTHQVFASATNEPIHEFQQRLLQYDESPRCTVVRYSGPENCFTPLEYWESLKETMSAEDYDRYINCKDVPREGRVYPTFGYKESKRALPTTGDVTAALTYEKYKVAYDYIVGFDPGSTTTASVILKAFAAPGVDERHWYALDEVTTRDATTDFHARDLAKWFLTRGIQLSRVLVLGDPHENKETDHSDFIMMRAAGFTAKPSNGGQRIERKHRVSMVNALLLDATGRRRLFLAPSKSGALQCAKLSEGLGTLRYLASGEIDMKHKTAANLAHWPDALGYGLFPFERMRGSYRQSASQPQQPAPFWRSPNRGT